MAFYSFNFFLLVVVTLFFYYLPWNRNLQVLILIIASFVFYGFAHPWLLTLLLFCILINSLTTYLIYRNNSKSLFWAATGVIINVGILVFFKYIHLITQTIFGTSQTQACSVLDYLLAMPLPLGISFYTFQGIGLVIDTYRSKNGPTNLNLEVKNFKSHLYNTTLFGTFFPKLISGPIVPSHDFFLQIKKKELKNINFDETFKLLILGYFLKMVVADNLKDYTFWIAYPYFQTLTSFNLIVLLLGYSIQIFADFAGYSLIAMGIAELFGYKLMKNFNFPYISQSFSEFWTRWHISLSQWLRTYLYIPLGGNRKGDRRTYLNILAVMFLCGLWHGAAWSYAFWGLLHGIALSVERFFVKRRRGKGNTSLSLRVLKTLIVFMLVSFGWLFFKLPDFGNVVLYLQSVLNNWSFPINKSLLAIPLLLSSPVFAYHFLYLYSSKINEESIKRYEYFLYGIMLFFIIVNSGGQNEFIYFQF